MPDIGEIQQVAMDACMTVGKHFSEDVKCQCLHLAALLKLPLDANRCLEYEKVTLDQFNTLQLLCGVHSYAIYWVLVARFKEEVRNEKTNLG